MSGCRRFDCAGLKSGKKIAAFELVEEYKTKKECKEKNKVEVTCAGCWFGEHGKCQSDCKHKSLEKYFK